MDVGTALRDAREQRGRSLDQLAHTTKIRPAILQAIEANRREKLPETIFLRGFLRTYAREVGLDPEETVRQYLSQFEPTPVLEVVKPGRSEARRQAGAAVRYEFNPQEVELWARRIGLVIVVIGVAISFAVIRSRAPRPPATPSTSLAHASDHAASPSDSGATTVSSPGNQVATTGSVQPAAAGATARDLLHVDLEVHRTCWLAATVDGTRVVYRLMQPGERQTIEIHDEAVLRIGDPAAVALAINGQDARMLGQAGEPVTAHITPQNYRAFLRAAP